MVKDTHVTARMPAELLEQLEELAAEHERSVSGELRVAVRAYCERLRLVDVEPVTVTTTERTPR